MSTAPTRARNPRGEGGRLRDQLVRATAELVDELGDTSRLSVRAIARSAGVSPTALYLHFPDRDALVTATCDAGFAGLMSLLRECDPALGEEEARLRAIAVWSGLHGFAMLRAARPRIGWPPAEDFVRLVLAPYVPRPAG